MIEWIQQAAKTLQKVSENIMSTDNISAIDKALNDAKARKAVKAQANGEAPTGGSTASAPAEKPAKASDAEKLAAKAAKDAERAAAKSKRDAERAEKQAVKDAAKRTPHMSKVDKAAEKLPSLSSSAQASFNDVTTNLSATDISALAAHLTHFNRVQATGRALTTKIEVGDTVRIVSGDARYLGATGTVAKAQRIRCYVTVEGASKDVYLYNSDVEKLASASPAAAVA